MSRLPRVTATELLRALGRDGGYEDHQTGSHKYLRHPSKPGLVVVPFHRGDLKTGTIAGILDQAGITSEQLRRLL